MLKQTWIVKTSRGYLADTTERTAPLVAHTVNISEAVKLSKADAEEEARQVKGKVMKLGKGAG